MSGEETAAPALGECIVLEPGRPLDIRAVDLEHVLVPAGQVAAGAPTTGLLRLGRFTNLKFGVWEMSAGGMHDVETEELFLVVSGCASVQIHDDGGASSTAELSPGTLMRLSAGMRTTWTVHEPLRKLYLAPQL